VLWMTDVYLYLFVVCACVCLRWVGVCIRVGVQMTDGTHCFRGTSSSEHTAYVRGRMVHSTYVRYRVRTFLVCATPLG
jgi:hypothetical protein